METFAHVLPFVLKHEGGFSDHPADKGGPTKYGISLRMAVKLGDIDGDGRLDFDIDGDGDVDADDIRQMNAITAGRYYRQLWARRRLDEVTNQHIAAKIFDLMVVSGFKGSSHIVQRALRACGTAVLEDGIMGSGTIQSINLYTGNMLHRASHVLFVATCAEAAGFFRSLQSSNFEAGWLRRAYDRPEGYLYEHF